MKGYWARARYGRVLHFFVGPGQTACGQMRWGANPRDAHPSCGYEHCARCRWELAKHSADEVEVVG